MLHVCQLKTIFPKYGIRPLENDIRSFTNGPEVYPYEIRHFCSSPDPTSILIQKSHLTTQTYSD